MASYNLRRDSWGLIAAGQYFRILWLTDYTLAACLTGWSWITLAINAKNVPAVYVFIGGAVILIILKQ